MHACRVITRSLVLSFRKVAMDGGVTEKNGRSEKMDGERKVRKFSRTVDDGWEEKSQL